MIPLAMKVAVHGTTEDFVTRVPTVGSPLAKEDATWVSGVAATLSVDGVQIEVPSAMRPFLSGDVLLVSPHQRIARRLVRAGSPHNFFLVTEQCDQLCVMCSQPPKRSHQDRFTFFQKAAVLAPHGLAITITGGEPTLHKERLFEFFRTTLAERPDLRFRVLSNAQHFVPQDRSFLEEIRGSVSWGIPLYSADPAHHDEVVGKVGAFEQLLTGLAILGSAGAAIELRTVVTRQTLRDLARTAGFVAANVAFVSNWAIMQLEAAGYARARWNELFADTSTEFEEVAKALDIAKLRGVDALLFNFPLCTIPSRYRSRAPRTISDWKTKYLRQCKGCSLREQCGGFFEWYPEDQGFQRLELQ